jgi:hypothetical protein
MYRTLIGGSSFGSYDTRTPETALKRSQLATAFFLSLTGPKIIWQFGELGYDISIDQNGRVGEKPVLWNYLNDPQRLKLFDVYSAMLRLRSQFDVFTSGKETLSVYGSFKNIQLSQTDHNISLIGNFGLALQAVSVKFQHTGIWYEFFSGDQLDVTDVNMSLLLSAGEYRLYSDKKLPAFKELATSISNKVSNSVINIYPNPVTNRLQINSKELIQRVELFSVDGKMIRDVIANVNILNMRIDDLYPGLYFLKIKTSGQLFTEKIVKK